jgi:glycosyltransferase involved in cell wall biosynthesis
VLISHQENFGIAVAESLACGTPVLISNKVNIHTEIQEDRAGFVGEDTLVGAEQLLRQWKRLSEEEKTIMKHSARFCYETRFGISRVATNLLEAIEGLGFASMTDHAQLRARG